MASIKELQIPDELRPARASFGVMKQLLASKGMKNKTLGYLCGMYTLQILFDLGESADVVIKPLLESLEKFKQANQTSMFGETQFGRVVRDEEQSRRLLNQEATAVYNKAKGHIEQGKTSQATVSLLTQASVLYQASSSMFPAGKKGEEEEEEEEEEENPGEVEPDSDLESDSEKKPALEEGLREIQDEAITLEKAMEGPVATLVAEEPKEPLLTNKIVRERVAYCNHHARRIIECFRVGKNPNEDLVGILSVPEDDAITQEQIDKTIADALNMPDDDYDEVFLEDQGAVIFPKAPRETTPEEPENAQEEEQLQEPEKEKTPQMEVKPTDSKPKLSKEELEKQLTNEELLQSAAKYCKYAISAITYDDVDTVIAELKKALHLAEKYKELSS